MSSLNLVRLYHLFRQSAFVQADYEEVLIIQRFELIYLS